MGLSHAWLKNSLGKPAAAQYDKSDRDGLSARVSKNGKISFQIRYRYDGKPKRLKIGSFPQMSLIEAREEATRLRGKHDQGIDPAIARKAERVKIKTAGSFESNFREWYDKHLSKDIDNPWGHLRSFEIHVFPELGDVPLNAIGIREWVAFIDPISNKVPSIAYRILGHLKRFYEWAVLMELTEVSPVASLSAKNHFKIKKGQGERALTARELYYVWKALDNSRTFEKNVIFMKLLVLSGARTKELRTIERRDIDLKRGLWVVPVEKSKNKEIIPRPLIPPVVTLFERAMELSAHKSYLFTNARYDREGEELKSGFMLTLPKNLGVWLEKNEGVVFENWSAHDLRRTCRSMIEKHVDKEDVAEKCLGHKLEGIKDTYNKYHFLGEMRAAYTALYEEVMGIVNAETPPAPTHPLLHGSIGWDSQNQGD